MMQLPTKLLTDTWIPSTWDNYIQTVEDPKYQKAKCYYYNGRLKIEMSPVGNDHANDHTSITLTAGLFAGLKNIPMNGKDNCTYRKTGCQDAQPDLSYYIGEKANSIPWGTTIIDLDTYPPPDLVIEIANTSLADDKGEKRLLYEDLKVQEYWVIDVQTVQVIAFTIENNGSRRITKSQVLPSLEMSVVQEALQRTRQMTQSEIVAWLLTQFQQ